MLKKVSRTQKEAIRYLEVGAGSGAVTKYLVKRLQREDRLDIVELDPHFCKKLRKKYGHLPNVRIHEASILDFEEKDFDIVVSSLPLNAFTASTVDQILLKYKWLVKTGGFISYFEYIGLGRLKALYLSGKPQIDFQTILSLKKSFVQNYCKETARIWLNFPPARVFHCQL